MLSRMHGMVMGPAAKQAYGGQSFRCRHIGGAEITSPGEGIALAPASVENPLGSERQLPQALDICLGGEALPLTRGLRGREQFLKWRHPTFFFSLFPPPCVTPHSAPCPRIIAPGMRVFLQVPWINHCLLAASPHAQRACGQRERARFLVGVL